MWRIPNLFRDTHCASMIAVTALIAACVGFAGGEWGWQAGEVLTITGLVGLLGGMLVYTSNRRVAALEMALERLARSSPGRHPSHASDAIMKVARYTNELDGQYDHARKELQRLRLLLDEAIAKLVSGFLALHDLALRARSLVDHSCRSHDCPADASPRDEPNGMAELVEQYEQHIADIVTTLQFQDIAAQLVDHAGERIDRAQILSGGLGTFFAALERADGLHASVDGTPPFDELPDHVDHVRRMARANPVTVARIAPGDVDLF